MNPRRVELASDSGLRSEIDPDGGWVATTAEGHAIVDAFDPEHGHLFGPPGFDDRDMSESSVEIDELALRRIADGRRRSGR